MTKEKETIEIDSTEENNEENEEINDEYLNQIMNESDIIQEEREQKLHEKKRIIISKKVIRHSFIYQISNWCQLGNNKIVLFDTSENQIYELKKIPIEYGCWYFDETVIADGSYTLSSRLDPFFIVLHFIQINSDLCESSVEKKEDFCLLIFVCFVCFIQ